MDRIARVIAALLTVVGVLAGFALRAAPLLPGEAVAFERVPMNLGNWEGQEVAVTDGTLAQLGSDALLLRSYRQEDGVPVWLYVDYHRMQRLGSTVHSPRVCYPGSGWSIERADVTELGDGTERPACWLGLRRDSEEMLAVYWYQSRWGSSARETTLKLHIARSAMARRESDVVLFRASTPVMQGDEAAARARLLRFLDDAAGSVHAALPFETVSS